MPKFTFSLTTLVSQRFPQSRAFYRDVLGLETSIDSGTHVMFTCGLSIWEAAFARQLVFGADPVDHEPSFSHELCFDCLELDAAQELLQANNVTFVHEIRKQPWEQRVLRLRDPDGRYLEIGEPLHQTVKRVFDETGSREETAQRTFVPLQALDALLK